MRRVSPRLTVAFFFIFFTALFMANKGRCHEIEAQGDLNFGVFPYKSPKILVEMFGPVVMQLQKKLGRKVVLHSAPDAKTFAAKVRAGEYDFILSTPTLFYKLRASTPYTVIARGEPEFYGGVVTRKDSGITSVADLKGKKIAAVGNFSYAGYIFLLPQLREKGIDPAVDVDIQFLTQVDSIVYGVMNKKYDAGVFREDAFQDPSFAAIRDQLTIIARSPAIPQFPFMVKQDLGPSVTAAIVAVLTGLNFENPAEQTILSSLQVKKIVPAADTDYDAFYENVKDTEFLKQP